MVLPGKRTPPPQNKVQKHERNEHLVAILSDGAGVGEVQGRWSQIVPKDVQLLPPVRLRMDA